MVFVKRIAHFFLFLPARLLAGSLVQRVFAASYTIYDGGRTYHYTGFPGSPDSLLERAGVSLEDLEEELNETGWVETYQNGESQFGMKKSAAADVHISLTKNLNAIMKQLLDLVPPAQKESRLAALMDQ